MQSASQPHNTLTRMKSLIARELKPLGAQAAIPFEVTYSLPDLYAKCVLHA